MFGKDIITFAKKNVLILAWFKVWSQNWGWRAQFL